MLCHPKSIVLLGFALTALICPAMPPASSESQLSPSKKAAALENAVGVLPFGQTIDGAELPVQSPSLDRWMSKLSDTKPISLVSIPATHDAGTALAVTGDTRCQVMTIPAQLKVGIRGFDVRLRLVGKDLQVYHHEESQHLSFDRVMSAFLKFLQNNPDEFIVMRIREESKALNTSETFESAFEKVQQSPRYAKLFYRAQSRNEIPSVQESRGKIVLLDNYGKLADAIDYPNPTMNVQDDYDTSDMEKKYSEIVANFESAMSESTGKTWDVNYTSSSTAQVDQLQNAQAVNAKVVAYLQGKQGNLGLVFLNFPGVQVIREIVASNFGPNAAGR